MAVKHASLAGGSSLFLPFLSAELSCSGSSTSFSNLPAVGTLFSHSKGHFLSSEAVSQVQVSCSSIESSRTQRGRIRKGRACSAVAAPFAPQTNAKPLLGLDDANVGDATNFDGEGNGLRGVASNCFNGRLANGQRGRLGAPPGIQEERWEAIIKLRADAKQGSSDAGDGQVITPPQLGRLGRLQKLLETVPQDTEEGETPRGQSLLEPPGRVHEAQSGQRIWSLRRELERGPECGHDGSSRREDRSSWGRQKGAQNGSWQREDWPNSGGQGGPWEKENWSSLEGREGSANAGDSEARRPQNSWEPKSLGRAKAGAAVEAPEVKAPLETAGEGIGVEHLQFDLGVEEDIAGALDDDLAALLSRQEEDPVADSKFFPGGKGERGNNSSRGGAESAFWQRDRGRAEGLTLGIAPVKKRQSVQQDISALFLDSPPSASGRASALPFTTGHPLARIDSQHKQQRKHNERAESKPAPSEPGSTLPSNSLPDSETMSALDSLLNVLEDTSILDASDSTPPNQRAFKTQYSLRVRQQKALSATVEDETLLQRPWEVEEEEARPTGPRLGLERFVSARTKSPNVRERSTEPRHTKRGGPWQPSKLKQFYMRKNLERRRLYGEEEASAEMEAGAESDGRGGVVGRERRKEEPTADPFLFPPLPRPIPHEIVRRRKLRPEPPGKFFSVPPKQRGVLPLREAASVSRGLGRGLVNPELGSSRVTVEMRAEGRRGVLSRLLVVEEAEIGKVLDRCATCLQNEDLSFLLHELGAGGATNRALRVLDWAEKEPGRLSRLLPGAAGHATVLRALVRDGVVMSAADLAVFLNARGTRPVGELCGLLLAGMAEKGDHPRVLELLNRMEMQGLPVDGRGWSALICSCARKNKRAEMGRLMGRVTELVKKDELKLTGLDYEEILGAVSSAGLVSEALDLVRLMEGEGFHVGAHVRESVMWAFSKAGQHNRALGMYGGESQPSLYMHNLAIRSLCHLSRYVDAKDLLRNMMGSTTKPDIITYNTLIGSLSRAQQRNKALEVLMEMQENGCCPTPSTFKALGSG